MSQSKEIWKDIVGFEGLYQVSNMGRVRGLDRYKDNYSKKQFVEGVVLRTYLNIKGYEIVKINKNSKTYQKSVHRLVIEHFLGKKNFECNHINKIKNDNRLCNLEYSDPRENATHRDLTRNTSSKYIGVCWAKRKNKWISYITVNSKRVHLGYYKDEKEAAKAYIDYIDQHNIKNKYAKEVYYGNL